MLIVEVMLILFARVFWVRTDPVVRFLAQFADWRDAAAILAVLEIVSEGRAASTRSGEGEVAAERGELDRDERAHEGEADTGNADVGFDDDPDTSRDNGPGGVCLYDGGE